MDNITKNKEENDNDLYKCDLIKMAGEIAKVEHIHLLIYIQREIVYDIGENYENEDDII